MKQQEKSLKVGIVGTGPRGLSILERLAARLISEPAGKVQVYLIDNYEVGCGRIWRTTQAEHYLMNTPANEVSAFSGQLTEGEARPGAGPSLEEWWEQTQNDYPGPKHYAPRRLYGEYMQFVLQSIKKGLNPDVELIEVNDEVIKLNKEDGRSELVLQSGKQIVVDSVVLTTGHALPQLTGKALELASFSLLRSGLKYIQGDSAADMKLDRVAAHETVGIIGLGLSFYDVLAEFTTGRGGKFIERNDGGLDYICSGREPQMFAGSRSGVPIPSRGLNQKEGNKKYQPAFFTNEWAKELRKKGKIDFIQDALPVLMAEVHLVYFATAIRHHRNEKSAQIFTDIVAKTKFPTFSEMSRIAKDFGINDLPELDVEVLARPFKNKKFLNEKQFHESLLNYLEDDLFNAEQGNVNSPLKAALDTIRDTRSIIMTLVNFGGLTPESHENDFLNWYVPRSMFLTAGPPLERTKQLIALIKSGVLKIVGPNMQIQGSDEHNKFLMKSDSIQGSEYLITTVIDARIPTTNIKLDRSELTKNLIRDNIWTNYINEGESSFFVTGGVSISPAPFHPVNRNNQVIKDVYVIGIPTEHTRWLMQAGSSRPGFWTDFVQDADAIAENILSRDMKTTAVDFLSVSQEVAVFEL
ncbi:FAD/NAD(P)-binding protein [Photobacterium sp. CAU 1568]|uniref:FAD/NAD(P)-binding protein n=1 Tax=Photobacterium arenosum TaxID=2774143 RepID=A0ABR9BMC9_9GAMM|nr:FAD/NAD(P)-binding protein [Photobacterium arenosum]MBD8513642.1 FAD/NAD(P)-binding protein [Photobacterium arenosum]